MSESLLPYYVYILADPVESQSIFYVGMGCNDRVLHHWREVKGLIENELEAAHPKHQRMIEIAKNGSEPIEVVIGRFETRDEAYAVESTLINWVYGYANLTNKNRGHNPDQIRPNGEWGLIPGIDVERTLGEGGDMILVNLEDEKTRWIAEKGPSAKVGLALFEYINLISGERYKSELDLQGLKFSHRVTSSRVTFFLDDKSKPASPERRLLPNPICRIRMDGSTTRERLHLEFEKNEVADALSIFEREQVDVSLLGVTLIQPPKRSRYDLLIPTSNDTDIQIFRRTIDLALDAAVRSCLS